MMLARRIIALPPVAITAVFVTLQGAIWLVESLTSGEVRRFTWSVGIYLPSLMLLFWAFSLCIVAEQSMGARPRPLSSILFATTLLCLIASVPLNSLLFAALEDGSYTSFPFIQFVAAILVMLWTGMATRTLLNAIGDDPSPTKFVPFGLTFIAIFFLPVGVWFLQNRIRMVLGAQCERMSA